MKFNFAENRTVKNLDAVPTDFHGLYDKKEDGTYALSEEPRVKSAVAAIVGLNQALVASRGETEAAKKGKVDLGALSEYGDSVEGIAGKIKETIKALTEGGKVNVEKIRAEIAESFAKDGRAKDTRISALLGQLTSLLVDNAATSALGEAKGSADLLLPIIRNQVRVAEKDGKFLVNVVDAQNEIRYSGVTGQPMTIKELVGEMKGNATFGRAFDSEAPNGGGTKPGTTTPTTPGGTPKPATAQDSISKIARGLGAIAPRRAGA